MFFVLGLHAVDVCVCGVYMGSMRLMFVYVVCVWGLHAVDVCVCGVCEGSMRCLFVCVVC